MATDENNDLRDKNHQECTELFPIVEFDETSLILDSKDQSCDAGNYVIDLTNTADDEPQELRTAVTHNQDSQIKNEPLEAHSHWTLSTSTPSDDILPDLRDTSIPVNDEFCDGLDARNEDDDTLLAEFENNLAMQPSLHEETSTAYQLEEQSPLQPIDSDAEDEQATTEFHEREVLYKNLKDRNVNTLQDDIEFERATQKEHARKRLREERRNRDYEEAVAGDTLFLPERHVSIDRGDADAGTCQQEPVASSGDDHVILIASDDDQSSKAKKRRRKDGGNSKTSKGPDSGRVKKAIVKKRQRTQKKRLGADDLAYRSLFHQDIPSVANANQEKDEQPRLGNQGDKTQALKALIASLPESERDLYKGEKVDLLKASQVFSSRGAMKAIGPDGWKYKGLKSPLPHFQMLGISWMRNRENEGKPSGGILGDTMGFGKTIMTIANIIDGKPPNQPRSYSKATLIIVPTALLSQWLQEFGKHIEEGVLPNVVVYRSKKCLLSLNPVEVLGGQDVVITSYTEVLKSMPRNEPPTHLVTNAGKATWWKEYYEQNRGLLHRVAWYRIVLDEAQTIKNTRSLTSEAVRSLKGKYRWCLSGTPIQNSLDEFYPYFAFLRFEHAGESYELFKKNYCKRGSAKAMQRLQVVLSKIMLRRTHEHKLFGRPILKLPPIKPVKTIQVRFNPVERAIYNIVENRMREKIKSFGSGVDKQYSQIFVMILRLRQLVGHPLLIQKTLKDLMETEDLERLWMLTDKIHSQSKEDDGSNVTVAGLEVVLKNVQDARNSSTSSSTSSDNRSSTDFRKYLNSLRESGQWSAANERSLCHSCGMPPESPMITPCLHLYCHSCLQDLWFQALTDGNDKLLCLECHATFSSTEPYQAHGFKESGRIESPSIKKRKSTDGAIEDIDWFVITPMLRSAKIKGAATQIKQWFFEDKDSKIVVFAQFRGMIKIMARICREEHWGYVEFEGSMSFEARDEVISQFTKAKSTKILIAAMKAGGTGLNLTAGNRVIILDLWWNVCLESQAFCRCYRIGQERPVEVVRFAVTDSIDTHIMALQARKEEEISRAMEDRHRPKNLTIKELLGLFAGNEGQEGVGRDEDAANGSGEDEPFTFAQDPFNTCNDEISDVEMADAA